MPKSRKCPPQLRDDAAARLAHAPAGEVPARPAAELLHELQLHPLDLEMRNEELRAPLRCVPKEVSLGCAWR
jgi:hypothetical protein